MLALGETYRVGRNPLSLKDTSVVSKAFTE